MILLPTPLQRALCQEHQGCRATEDGSIGMYQEPLHRLGQLRDEGRRNPMGPRRFFVRHRLLYGVLEVLQGLVPYRPPLVRYTPRDVAGMARNCQSVAIPLRARTVMNLRMRGVISILMSCYSNAMGLYVSKSPVTVPLGIRQMMASCHNSGTWARTTLSKAGRFTGCLAYGASHSPWTSPMTSVASMSSFFDSQTRTNHNREGT